MDGAKDAAGERVLMVGGGGEVLFIEVVGYGGFF